MAFSTSDYERLLRQAKEQQKYMEYSDYHGGFVESGSGAATAVKAQEPKKPQHLNPKLLLTKGA